MLTGHGGTGGFTDAVVILAFVSTAVRFHVVRVRRYEIILAVGVNLKQVHEIFRHSAASCHLLFHR